MKKIFRYKTVLVGFFVIAIVVGGSINANVATAHNIADDKSIPSATIKQAEGNFEGKYKVGKTTCTVKPIKMAFEVKWKNKKKTEIYFAKEGEPNTFASNPAKGKASVFSFDDENYNTGTFHGADGKKIAIKRMK